MRRGHVGCRERLAQVRARRDERGAALVEFALVVTLLLLLIFGMVEFGLDYNNYIVVRNGSREGARLAVVNDVNNVPSCTIAGATVTPPATPANWTDATNALDLQDQEPHRVHWPESEGTGRRGAQSR